MDMDIEQQEMILDFVEESRESLDAAEPMFITMSNMQDPEQRADAINGIFRLWHSLKGGAGFLNLNTVKDVAHVAENLLQLFRKEPDLLNSDHIDTLTKTCDLLSRIMNQVEQEFHDNGFDEESEEMISQLQGCLDSISSGGSAPATTVPPKAEITFEEAELIIEEPSIDMTMDTPEEESAEVPAASPEIDVTIVIPENEEPRVLTLDVADDLLGSFLQESEELLESSEGVLLVLERLGTEVDQQEYVDTLFRHLHTTKGNAGLLGLEDIEKISHKAETLLSQVKEKTRQADGVFIQVFLKVIDILRQGLQAIGKGFHPSEAATTQMMQILEALESSNASETTEDVTIEEPPPEPEKIGDILVDLGVPETSVSDALEIQQAPLGEVLVKMGATDEKTVEKAIKRQEKTKPAPTVAAPSKVKAASRSAIRVQLDKIDQLVNMVGELVISGAMVVHNPDLEGLELKDFESAVTQLNKNIREVQEVAMSMRMIPVEQTFKKMIRVVHDVSKKIGKNVELQLAGEDTEIDKTIIEQIADPLLHIVRNAVDHGIDTPEERAEAGKPEMGRILLEARHSGNEIWIVIQDDGRGLNRDKILERAYDRGLASPDMELPDSEIWKLVFEPGFSTAEQVTDLSGRGVGMDVVKKNIEKLRGKIDVHSEVGVGSTFILKIPLTLAIIDAMLICVGDTSYAAPIVSIQEMLQPLTEDILVTETGLEMVKIRGDLLPIIKLHELHDVTPKHTDFEDGTMVILEESGKRIALFVDEVVGQQQIVIKGLPGYLGHIQHLAGCTIMGNGEITLILDSGSLSRIVKS